MSARASSAAFAVALTASCAASRAVLPWTLPERAPASRELLDRGRYLTRACDCDGCHTDRNGRPFAGGLPLSTPIGTIFATNITPDIETGIGGYSLDEFAKAMREGVAKDGHRLYPAMPYSSYALLSGDELSALYAYVMQCVESVSQPNRVTQLSWPLNQRWLLAVWDALFARKAAYVVDPKHTARWNRGAFLVQGPGHCGECHTPRGIAGQLGASSEADGPRFLAGATFDQWHAAALTGDFDTGLEAWSPDEIVEYLKTGRTARAGAVGPMAEVIAKSTQYLTDDDLSAIAGYLKSLPAGNRARQAVPSTVVKRETPRRGSRVYLDNCNACHGSDGSGASRTFPNLVANEAVAAADPSSLIHVVLAGASMPSTSGAPSALAMPDFAWRLSDDEVADVLTFIRSSWGNQAAAVGAEDVRGARRALGPVGDRAHGRLIQTPPSSPPLGLGDGQPEPRSAACGGLR